MRNSTIALCMLCLLLPVASSAGVTIRHVPDAGSGACLSRSPNACLFSCLGRRSGVHELRIPDGGKSGDAGHIGYEASSLRGGERRNVTGLAPGYPNPLNPATTIEYSVEAPSRVLLAIFSVQGELVRTLVDERVASGAHAVRWNGMNARGDEVASGIYFVRLDTEWGVFSRKVIVVR